MAFEEALSIPLPIDEPRPRLSDARSFEPTISGLLVKPAIHEELAQLQQLGYDAGLIDMAPTYILAVDTQLEVDKQSSEIGKLDGEAFDTLFDPIVHSAGAKWAMLSKRAIALWALKQAGNEDDHAIAPLIYPAIYDEPLFDGKSAHQVLHKEHPRSAVEVSERYREITTTPLEDNPFLGDTDDSKYLRFVNQHGFSYLSSKDFLTGVLDSRAVDTRALAASHLALAHVVKNPEIFEGRPLVTASLACGAAAPMFELNELFASKGIQIGRNILVDNDPMALASAVALGRAYGMEEKVDAQLEDIVGKELTEFVEPNSVDVVDILGIVDYLPTSVMGYRAAENFIGKIANIMRPGGIIVAGNALKARPHQAFFEKVWPTLQQRNPIEMVNIMERAGFASENLEISVPQREGVYGVYALKVPKEGLPVFKEARTQRAAKKILTVASKFNKY